MSNQTVDGTDEDQQDELKTQTQPQHKEPRTPPVSFRIAPSQIIFYKRLADYLWKEGKIAEPSLNAAAKFCLNVIGYKYAQFEEQNYESIVGRRIADTRQSAINEAQYFRRGNNVQPQQLQPQRQVINTEYGPAVLLDNPRPQPQPVQPVQQRRNIPEELKVDSPVKKAEVDFY